MAIKVTEDPAWLFERLQKTLSDKPGLAERIRLHVQAKTGHVHLAAYHNNGGSESEKVAMYQVLLKAALTGDTSALETPSERVPSRDTLAEKRRDEAPEPAPVAVVPREVALPKPSGLEAIIAAAIEPYIRAQANAGVDEAAVKAIVDSVMAERLKNLEAKVDGYLAKVPARDAVEIRNGDAVKELTGIYHWQLPQVIAWIGADVPLWLWGKAGGGKTVIARQVAKALGLDATVISIDPTMTVGKLMGFRNLATGEFVEGWLVKPYKDGGLVAFDEIDTGDPGILASVNALIANDEYLFPNGETVKRHPRFRIMAGANTNGAGAVAGYTARNRLDAATLDRFAIVELEYDGDLEFALALGKPKSGGIKQWKQAEPATDEACEKFVAWVQRVRNCVGNSVLVSPRASILGVRALRAGVQASEVVDALVFKLATPDTKQNVINQIGAFCG